MNSPLIILDRDGVINFDSDDYIKSAEEWNAIESSLVAIAKLSNAGYKIGIATNQSGLARELFSYETLTKIHKKMTDTIEKNGGKISAIELCPDHPNHAGPNRKPAPGMALSLLKQFNATAKNTWFVGDSISDINCAVNSGCKPALVLTGKGKRTVLLDAFINQSNPVPVYNDLLSFTNCLLEQ